MITVAGTYRHGKVELETTPAGVHDDDPVFVMFPESRLAERKPVDLCGIWKGKFPEDLDIDSILHEIRNEWTAELDEFN